MEDDYSDKLEGWSQHEMVGARELAGYLCYNFNPKSVIDIGCGSGLFLLEFIDRNIETLGIDGEPTAGKLIPNFEIGDFTKITTRKLITKKYDLAICLEVAEHIKSEFTNNFVSLVSLASDLLVFSAAKPNQVGTFHHNCQSKSYWIDKFRKHGYEVDGQNSIELLDFMRNNNDFRSTPWLEDNIMVLRRKSE